MIRGTIVDKARSVAKLPTTILTQISTLFHTTTSISSLNDTASCSA